MTKNEIILSQEMLINKLKTILTLYEGASANNMLASLVRLLKESAVCSVCGIAITRHLVKKGAIGYNFKYHRPDTTTFCFLATVDVTKF